MDESCLKIHAHAALIHSNKKKTRNYFFYRSEHSIVTEPKGTERLTDRIVVVAQQGLTTEGFVTGLILLSAISPLRLFACS